MTNPARNCRPANLRCQTCPIEQAGLCGWFEGSQRRDLANRSTQTHFAQGETILGQDQAMSKVGFILSGFVKIVMNDGEGQELLIQLLHQGDLVGDALARVSAFSWQAATDVELCWVPPAVLHGAIGDNPTALRAHLQTTNRQAQERQFAQVALRGRNTVERVAQWLSVQIARDAVQPLMLRVLLSRRDLASLLEMTVETLCRALHQLERHEVLRLATSDLVEILDIRRLRRLARSVDDRVQATLLQDAWEWGARRLPVPRIGARKMLALAYDKSAAERRQ